MARLIALDLDGTALTSDRVPHLELPAALKEAQAEGIEIVLATGRNIHSLGRIAPAFGISAHWVCANGCLVRTQGGDFLSAARISPDALRAALDYAIRTDTYIHAESREQMVAWRDGPERERYQRRSGIPVQVVDRETFENSELTHLLVIADPDTMPGHHSALKAVLGDTADLIFSERDYLEILPKGVHKGVGLQTLVDHLGIAAADCAVLGDYSNDLPMLRWAGIPAAVGNAVPEVQKAAIRVFATNNEGGAVEFVRWIVYNVRKEGAGLHSFGDKP